LGHAASLLFIFDAEFPVSMRKAYSALPENRNGKIFAAVLQRDAGRKIMLPRIDLRKSMAIFAAGSQGRLPAQDDITLKRLQTQTC
jgi:hypothetical protein